MEESVALEHDACRGEELLSLLATPFGSRGAACRCLAVAAVTRAARVRQPRPAHDHASLLARGQRSDQGLGAMGHGHGVPASTDSSNPKTCTALSAMIARASASSTPFKSSSRTLFEF